MITRCYIQYRDLLNYFLFLLIIYSSTVVAVETESTQSFSFFTWSEYIDPQIVQQFEQKFNVKINFVYYETDDARDNAMAESNGQSFDLILVSGIMLDKYIQQGWLEAIDYAQIQNSSHLAKRWLPKDTQTSYRIPYFWGTLGIAYRKDLVKDEIKTWQQFFSPSESLRGKILMINNAKEATAVALKSLGYSANSNDLSQIKQAGRLLEDQKPYVKKYSYLTINKESSLITGEISTSMIYSGDALFLKNQHPDIIYVLPEEGGLLWTDYLAIRNNSPKKQLVMKFLDFINQPEIAAQNAQYVFFATPNKSAERHLPQDFLNNTVIYPDSKDRERLELLTRRSLEAQKIINNIMLNLVNN